MNLRGPRDHDIEAKLALISNDGSESLPEATSLAVASCMAPDLLGSGEPCLAFPWQGVDTTKPARNFGS
ncbi:MAG: hypothetical protein MUC92_01050 [Fimbriimonadaceae bacterium]|nr:hypothetical protein [Fimbriimonadaceae bacterium]